MSRPATDPHDSKPRHPPLSDITGRFNTSIPPSVPHPVPSYRTLAVLRGHAGPVSSLSLCGEFVLTASHGNDIIAWQQPDLRRFARFGHGNGSVKALVSLGNKVYTAHQDAKIRVWKASVRSGNAFRLVNTLPTTKDYLGRFMKESNYVATRRNHRKLWIEHADSISCLIVSRGRIYSGSWDKTLKVWRLSDLRCLESIKAHDDAINGLCTGKGVVYSASADGKIKAWGRNNTGESHSLKGVLKGHKGVSLNTIVISEDGRRVYGGGSDGFVIGWEGDAESGRWGRICEKKAHGMAILCMCVVGEFVFCGSADCSVSVWRMEGNGEILKVEIVRGHEGPVKCVQAMCYRHGDGGDGGFILYTGSLDKSLRVWWIPKKLQEKTQTVQTIIQKKSAILGYTN